MELDWNSLSMEEITALYLYGESSVPSDLTSGAIVNRPGTFEDGTVGATVTIDAVSYMDNGPGRFAYGSLSGLVNAFMDSAATDQDLKNNVAHTVGQNGEVIFSKTDIMNYFIGDGIITDKEVAINIKQYNYQDGTDDIAKRTYISNSTAFQLVDDAQFVIDADGVRHIDNYAVIPRLKSKQYPGENFDLTGGGWITNKGNQALANAIDPWGIGRKVDIDFNNRDLVPRISYGSAEYQADINARNRVRSSI